MDFNEIKSSFVINESFIQRISESIESDSYNILYSKMERHLDVMERFKKVQLKRENLFRYLFSLFDKTHVTQEEFELARQEKCYMIQLQTILFNYQKQHELYHQNLISMETLLVQYHARNLGALMTIEYIELKDNIRQCIKRSTKMEQEILKQLNQVNQLVMWLG